MSMDRGQVNIDIYYSQQKSVLRQKLFSKMDEYSQDWPDDRAFVLVPERETADLERAYLERSQANGLMMAEVLSFNRLAQRIFAEAEGAAVKTVSRAGKSILAQNILLKYADAEANNKETPEASFQRFQHLAKKPKFASEMVDVISEFYRYDIDAASLLQYVEAGRKKKSVREVTLDKLSDFANLKKLLEENLAVLELKDSDRNLDRAYQILKNAEQNPRLKFLERAQIFVFGFGTDWLLTKQEARILQALAEKVKLISFFIQSDEFRVQAQVKNNIYSTADLAYAQGRETIRDILEKFPQAKTENLLVEREQKSKKTIVLAEDRRDEVEFVAGKIRSLLHSGAYRRRDIAVGLCETELSATELETAFAEYGIDAYIDNGKELCHSSCLRTLSQILELTLPDKRIELIDIMQYLRSGLSGLAEEDINIFENFCLSAGIKNLSDIEKMEEFLQESNRYVLQSRADSIKEKIINVTEHIELLGQFSTEIKKRRLGSDKLVYLESTILNPNSTLFNGKSLKKRVEEKKEVLLSEKREQEALNLAASWNALVELVDEAKLLILDTRMSQEHFVQMILAGLAGLSRSNIPLGIDRVRVDSLEHIVDYPAKILFILGADYEHFPLPAPSEGFLRNDERKWLAVQSNNKFPDRSEKFAVTQAFNIKELETVAEELYITAPTHSEDELSQLLRGWISLAKQENNTADTKFFKLLNDGESDARWNVYKYAKRAAMASNSDKIELWKAALTEIEKNKLAKTDSADDELILSAKSLLQLPQAFTLEELYSLRLPDSLSISAIQRYNACPFQYFVHYGIDLQERDVAKDDAIEQGSFIHRILELSLRDLSESLSGRDGKEKKIIMQDWRNNLNKEFLNRYYRQIVKEPAFHYYGRREVAGMMRDRILEHALATLIYSTYPKDGDKEFYPYALEWRFPLKDDHDPYALTVDERSIILKGFIDRVDVSPGDTGTIESDNERTPDVFRLIDYKRGNRSAKAQTVGLYDGTDIQIQIYTNVWQDKHPQMQGLNTSIVQFTNRFHNNNSELHKLIALDDINYRYDIRAHIKSKKIESQEQEEERTYALIKAEEAIHGIHRGKFPALPKERSQNDGSSPCKYCDYRALCYHDAISRNKAIQTLDKKTIREKITQKVAQEQMRSKNLSNMKDF